MINKLDLWLIIDKYSRDSNIHFSEETRNQIMDIVKLTFEHENCICDKEQKYNETLGLFI